jgi:hypothetical protein
MNVTDRELLQFAAKAAGYKDLLLYLGHNVTIEECY